MKAKIVCAVLLLSPLSAAGFAGCGSRESVDPVPVPVTTTEPTGHDDAGTPPPDAAPPARRTVSIRNPMGDGPSNNLLLDGDFELSSSSGTGQYGWRMFNSNGSGEYAMTLETGGLCRTGLSCVKLEKGRLMLGRGTAAAGGKSHVMGLHARLSEGAGCNQVVVYAVECDSFQVLKKAIADEEVAHGWCHYTAAFDASPASVCMYLQNTLTEGQMAIIDSAILGPADGTVVLKTIASEPPSAETLAEMGRVRDYVRRTTRFGAEVRVPLPPD